MKLLYFKACKDKELSNYSYYFKTPITMLMNFELEELKYKLNSISIYSQDGGRLVDNVEDAMRFISDICRRWVDTESDEENYIIRKKNSARKEKNKPTIKDKPYFDTKFTFLVYTDNIKIVNQYFSEYIVSNFNDKSLTTAEVKCEYNNYVIEFRAFTPFIDSVKDIRESLKLHPEITDAEAVYRFMCNVYNNIFIPASYFYMSPHQKTRKLIKHACEEYNYNPKLAFPTWDTYKWLNKGKFGGICYNPMAHITIDEPVIHADRASAYPYELLFNLYPIEQFKLIDNANSSYRKYNNSGTYATFGLYKITYNSTNMHYLTKPYKDVSGAGLEPGDNITISIALNNIDLKILANLLDITEITCVWLRVAKQGPLPSFLCDKIIELYANKAASKKRHDPAYLYNIIKRELNAVSGSLQLKRDTREGFEGIPKALNPAWGHYMLAYARKHLIDLVLSVSGAIYGDTDSIFCRKLDRNLETIRAYNDEMNSHIEYVCNSRGWDYELLKGIGTFEIEHICEQFRANNTKQYGYKYYNKYSDDEIAYIFPHTVVKAAGYPEGSFSYSDLFLDMFDRPQRPIRRLHKDDNGAIIDEQISEDEYCLRSILLGK